MVKASKGGLMGDVTARVAGDEPSADRILRHYLGFDLLLAGAQPLPAPPIAPRFAQETVRPAKSVAS